MIFTSDGKCYWLKVYKVPNMSRQSKGRSIANLLELGDEKIMSIKNVRTFDERQLVFATRKGIIKKTTLSAYGNVRANGIKAINLDDDDDLISVKITNGNDDILLATAKGMSIRFNESDVRSMGRVSRGVKGITLRKGDEVIGMIKLEDGDTVLTVCENGFGKRTELDEYRTQSRGGKGIINIKVTERNGRVVGVLAVTDDDDVMMMTRNGIIIRTGLDQLRTIGRNTAGVRMIKVADGDVVSSIARLIKDDSEVEMDETAQTAETAETPEPSDSQ
jgi:DNA gyrase subunit A